MREVPGRFRPQNGPVRTHVTRMRHLAGQQEPRAARQDAGQARTGRTLPSGAGVSSREEGPPAVRGPTPAGGHGPGQRCPGTSLTVSRVFLPPDSGPVFRLKGKPSLAEGGRGHAHRSLHRQLHLPGHGQAALSGKPSRCEGVTVPAVCVVTA